mmetsp:Transcript_53642/g.166519  ORF Transcript_53642/g.166519 Transcript_53642/m.166519 type:complete len:258 (+) Transcript_53642:1-774(+)
MVAETSGPAAPPSGALGRGHCDAGEAAGSVADVPVAVRLACPDLHVLGKLFKLLIEAVIVEARSHNLVLHVLAAEPPEDPLTTINELRDLAQDLCIDVRHQHNVAVVLVDVVVEHPDIVVAKLHLRPLLAGVHHQGQVAEALVKLHQVSLRTVLWKVQVTAKHAVGLLRKLPGSAHARVLGPVFLLAPKVVPPHALLVAALRLPEEDADLAIIESRHGHDAGTLVGAALTRLRMAVLLGQGRLRVQRSHTAQGQAIQ